MTDPLLPEIIIPDNFSIESTPDRLVISYRWFGKKYILGGIFGLVFLIMTIAMVQDGGVWFFMICPFSWVSLGLLYSALTGLFNSTTITATQNKLNIEHGPLPYLGNKYLNSGSVDQFYIKEKAHRHKNSISYSYDLHVKKTDGRHTKLLGLDTRLQALYLEQELEQFLGIEDRAVEGEPGDPALEVYQSVWKTVADDQNLSLTSGKTIDTIRVTGNYHGYDLALVALRKDNAPPGVLHTQLVMNGDPQRRPATYPTAPQAVKLMAEIDQSLAGLGQKFTVRGDGHQITYQQKTVERRARYIKLLFESFRQLLDTYPYLAQLGGEAILALHPITKDKSHSLRNLAGRWLEQIADRTLQLQRESNLICQLCLTHITAHELELSWISAITYFGCRRCHQSRDFYTVKTVIAVLNRRMETAVVQQGDILRANWFAHKEMFDFDAVEIINATDEDVERFAVQIGNDTDPLRQPRYQTMRCKVDSQSNLSENTMRILRRTFGAIEEIDDDPKNLSGLEFSN